MFCWYDGPPAQYSFYTNTYTSKGPERGARGVPVGVEDVVVVGPVVAVVGVVFRAEAGADLGHAVSVRVVVVSGWWMRMAHFFVGCA